MIDFLLPILDSVVVLTFREDSDDCVCCGVEVLLTGGGVADFLICGIAGMVAPFVSPLTYKG